MRLHVPQPLVIARTRPKSAFAKLLFLPNEVFSIQGGARLSAWGSVHRSGYSRRAMTRLYVVAAALGILACGSPATKSTESGGGNPTRNTEVTPADTKKSPETKADTGDEKLTLKAAPIKIPNGHLYDGYIVGGLPTKAAIDSALAKEIDSAISLMGRDEKGISEIGPYAASQGFRYIRFTIAGKDDLNESMAWQFASTLPLLDKPGIIHSANGKRVAAIFALMAYFVEERPAEEALAIGQAIGLGDLEDHVRDLLELPAP